MTKINYYYGYKDEIYLIRKQRMLII